jgi:hypothetical protein
MATPKLTPSSKTSAITLPATGTTTNSTDAWATRASLPYGIYQTQRDFVSGAVDQVSFTYKMLGGDVLDIELTEQNVYASYELATLEYSYIINTHQAKNVLSDFLGQTTGTFNQDGELKSGILSSSLSGTHIELKYPEFSSEYTERVANGLAGKSFIGDNVSIYSASISLENDVQDYDLQTIAESASVTTINNKKIAISRVYYKSPKAMWRFYGYYGGLNVVGNLQTYGQYSDETTFEVVPAWQNKLQARAFETSLYTRASHFSYEIRNNKIRLYPIPGTGSPTKLWFEFSVPKDSWEEDDTRKTGVDGINNINTLPFANIPYENINSIGKQWIRKYALAVSKEMLSQVRGKFGSIPIPGESVTLNASELASQAKEEQTALKEELRTLLDELTYHSLVSTDAEKVENSNRIQIHVPMSIYTG